MRRWVAAAAVAVLLLAGFVYAYGNPPPARASDQQGWSESRSSDSYGLLAVHQRSYESAGGIFGGAMVATAGDWPGVPEQAFVPSILDRVAEDQGMELTERGTETVRLTALDGASAEGTLYDVQKQGTAGSSRAIVVDFPCPRGPGYVIAVGYGTLGSNLVSTTYDKAKKVVRSVTCG